MQFEERLGIFYIFNILLLGLDSVDKTRVWIDMEKSRKIYLENKNRIQTQSQILPEVFTNKRGLQINLTTIS